MVTVTCTKLIVGLLICIPKVGAKIMIRPFAEPKSTVGLPLKVGKVQLNSRSSSSIALRTIFVSTPLIFDLKVDKLTGENHFYFVLEFNLT